jgi:hypothetical protein
MIKKFTLLLFLVFTSLVYATAQQMDKKGSLVRLLIGGALELGGDKIAEVYFTNGKQQSVRAGQGGSIAVGGQLEFPKAEKFLLRATVGYKYVTTAADNVHIRLTRIPIHFTANYMAAKKLRLGAGLAMHRNINFNSDGLGDDMKFHPANGPVFEVAYAGIGLTYTGMQYKDQLNNTYSANAIGLSFSLTIPGNK